MLPWNSRVNPKGFLGFLGVLKGSLVLLRVLNVPLGFIRVALLWVPLGSFKFRRAF